MDVDFWLEARGQTSSQLQSFLEGFSQLAKVMDFSDQKHTQTRFISRFQEVSSSKFHPKACWRKDGCKSCHWYSPREVLGSTWSVRNPMPRALGNPKDFHPTSRLHPKPPPRASSQHPLVRKNEKTKSWSHETENMWNKKNVFECFWTCSNLKENSKYF